MKTYTVYLLFKPDGIPFYVGKSSYENFHKRYQRLHVHRYQARSGDRTRKCIVIRKLLRLGLDVSMDIVFESSSESEAFAVEKLLIAAIPNLTNHTDGGEGQSGYRFSDDSRRRMSIMRTGRKIHNEASRFSISSAQRGENGNNATLSKTDAERVLRMRHDGAPYQVIADEFGVNIQTIANIVRGKSWCDLERPSFADVKVRGRWRSGHIKIIPERRAGIIAEYRNGGVTMSDLANRYNVSVATISLIVNLKRRAA